VARYAGGEHRRTDPVQELRPRRQWTLTDRVAGVGVRPGKDGPRAGGAGHAPQMEPAESEAVSGDRTRPPQANGPRQSAEREPPFSAPHTRSGVIGSSRMRSPVAAAMAFATAAGTPTTGGSPTPLAP
jgi:hypothetical protein